MGGLKIAPGSPQTAVPAAPDGPQTPPRPPPGVSSGPRCVLNCRRGPQDATRGLQEASQEGPKTQKSTISHRFLKDFGIAVFRFPHAQRRSKRAPRRPKSAPRRRRWPQDGPRGLQDGPRGPQEASQEGPERLQLLIFHCVFRCFLPSRLFGFTTLQDGPRGPEDRPKTAQEAPKTASRRPQTASRRP